MKHILLFIPSFAYILPPVMRNYSVDEPIYALATAYAPSALAVIRTSGKDCIELLAAGFSSPKRLLDAKSRSLVHGYIKDREGHDIDEVVLAVYRDGSGYTGQEAVEISCHGSLMVIKRLFVRLEELGFALAQKGEFTFRAFMSGRMDLTQAEAVEEIIASRSTASQMRALDRLEGRLRGRIEDIRSRLVDILSSLEVQLDYAEDEILDDWVFPQSEVDSITSELDRMIASYGAGRIHREGATVVLAGPTNAGKSSLFNQLVRQDRAIVSATPGTTRDFIEAWIDIKGIPVHLFDTAGIRESGDEIEGEGIRRSLELAEGADLVVYLMESDEELPSSLDPSKTIVVHSKNDLRKTEGELSVSSVTGEGLGELVDVLHSRLMEGQVSSDDGLVIDSERQRDCLVSCRDALLAASASKDESVDIMALFFQAALEHLGYISGEVTKEELLDNLFSRFCLGK